MSSRLPRSVKKKSLISTFTYYIPAPPHRKTGYREREFDKIMQGIVQAGHDIIEIHTQAVGGPENSGLFVIAVLKAKSDKVAKLDATQDIHEMFKLSSSYSSPDFIAEEEDA